MRYNTSVSAKKNIVTEMLSNVYWYHTFITTYGVAHNLHSGIVQSEVTMDDLFE